MQHYFLIGVLAISMLRGNVASAGEPTETPSTVWVRVRTGTEVAGDGFSVREHEPLGATVPHDSRTMTLEVKGQAVRFARPGQTIEGRVQAFDDNRIVVLQNGEEGRAVVVPRAAIVGLDVRQRPSRKGRGAAIGFGVGVLAGLALVASSDADERVLLLIPAVPIGTLLGLVVAPGAKWERNVPIDRIRVGLGPTRGHGIGLSVSLAF